MKVEIKRDNNIVDLKEIENGECFFIDGTVWIKTDVDCSKEKSTIICVNIENGHGEAFFIYQRVYKVSMSNVVAKVVAKIN